MVVLRFPVPLFLALVLVFSGCAHHSENSPGIKLTQDQEDELNREALSIASDRLERMVLEAKKSATAPSASSCG